MTPNAVHWFEIPAADLARARRFYEAIFAIEMRPLELGNGLTMAMFPATPTQGVGGALCHHPQYYRPSRDGVLVYLNADPDLAVVLGRIERSGGEVLVGKTQISPEYGYMAVFVDTEGNRVALHSRG